jgi:hemolysin activation/secretion protein
MLYKRFGIALFGNVGQVANQWNQMSTNNWLYTYGAGLRFQLNKNQKINLRIDVATDNKKVLPYFTIGEAF